jgi:hypothetical protein
MWQTVKTNALVFHRSFHKSAVIWFGRIQVLLGAAWFALTAVDLAPLIGNPKYVTAWLVFSGLVTEYARRSNTEENEDGRLVPKRDNQTITVNVNSASPAAAPAPASPLGPSSDLTK